MIKKLSLIVLSGLLMMSSVFPTFAQEEPPQQAQCSVEVSAGEDGNGGNAWVSVSVYDPNRIGEWPQVNFGDGGSFGFRINEDGNGSDRRPHYFEPGKTWTVTVEGYAGCEYKFTIEVNEEGDVVVAQIGAPDGSNEYCQFALPEWMPVGATLAVDFWNGQTNTWDQAPYSAEAKSDGVFINFGHRQGDNWGYRIKFMDAYIPFIYRGYGRSSDPAFAGYGWDLKETCQIMPELGII